MLSISKPLSSGQAQAYHKLEFTAAGQNYYKQGGAVEGEWQGRLASEFGLAGMPVEARDFALLSEGKDPRTGEQIVGRKLPVESKQEAVSAVRGTAEGAASAATHSTALSKFVAPAEQAEKKQTTDGAAQAPAEHRAGWDATFSAPKSVSLVALVGGDWRVLIAHREAVTAALAELERYTQARIGGNHPAETTGRMVAAKFEHDTARPVDGYAAPQLHTHAVIFNVTQRDSGRFRALQPRSFYDSQSYLTAVYQSELTQRLRDLGYELTVGKSGAPEIKGFSQEYLDASSPRSQQIKEYLEKAGMEGPAAAQIAAHATRDGKVLLSSEEVLAAHRKLAAEHGNQAERVVAEAGERSRKIEPAADPQDLRLQVREPTPFDAQAVGKAEREAAAKTAITWAKEHVFEREAVADRRTILRDALRRGMGQTTPAEIKAEFDRRHDQGEFRQAGNRTHDSERRFTTPETLAAERAVHKAVWDGHGAVEPIVKPRAVEKETGTKLALNEKPLTEAEAEQRQAASKPFLNATQKAVIEQILTSTDRIQGLQGLAGTGKTTTLKEIRQGAERAGFMVEGFAPTSKATGQLRDAGINARTLQKFLVSVNREPAEPGVRHLYMLDESSLASTRQMRDFLRKIAPEDRVLVIGDTRQHQGVDAGRPFEQMQQGGMRTAHLNEIVRQKDPELRRAVEHLAKGETAEGVKLLEGQGRITEIADAGERYAAIAKDYVAEPGSALMVMPDKASSRELSQPVSAIIISPDNASRRELNQAVRVEMMRAGKLQADAREFQTLVNRGDLTGADRAWAARYQAGDVIRYAKGSKQLGLERQSYATVTGIDAARNELTVRRADGESVSYDPARLRGVSAYREQGVEFATGDRLQFTAPDRKLGVANRDLATVTEAQPDRLTVKLDGKEGRSVSFDPRQMRHFDHGYAVTSHSSQGLTVGRVLINIDAEGPKSLLNTRLAYVAVSRAAQDARLYVSKAEGLDKLLASDVTKTAAIEYTAAVISGTPRAVGPKKHVAQAAIVDPTHQLRDAVRKLGTEEARVGVNMLEVQGRLAVEPERAARVNRLVEDYVNHREGAVAVVWTTKEQDELNRRIRGNLARAGVLSPDSRLFPILVERDISKKLAAAYKENDVIEFRAGSKERGIAPNTRARVLAIDAERNLLTIQTPDGEARTYNPAKLNVSRKSEVYEQEHRNIAVGERIRFQAAYTPEQSRSDAPKATALQLASQKASQSAPERLRAGQFATVEAIHAKGGLRVRTDAGTVVDVPAEHARHIEYGYAAAGTKALRADRLLVAVESPDQLTKNSETIRAVLGSKDARFYAPDRTALHGARTPGEIEAMLARTASPGAAEHTRQLPASHDSRSQENRPIPPAAIERGLALRQEQGLGLGL